jgi:hypothetical protein
MLSWVREAVVDLKWLKLMVGVGEEARNIV